MMVFLGVVVRILLGDSNYSVLARIIATVVSLTLSFVIVVLFDKPVAYFSIIFFVISLYFFLGFRSNFVSRSRTVTSRKRKFLK
jgi:hypothetical protein